MAKTRGAKTSSPSSRPRAPREAPVQGSMIEPSQPLAIPPSVEGAPLNSPSRQYEMRRPPTTPGASSFHAKKSSSRPPKKKARVSAPLEPSEPPLEPQSPATESQIPSGMTPELVIRPWSLSHPLRRYHMEHLMTPKDFFYPCVALDFYQSMTTHHVRDHTVIHFTIDERYGILGARHIAKALRIPYEPARLEDYRVWAHPSQNDMVHILSRGASPHPYLLRKEFSPNMFFIDALLRHTSIHFSIWCRGEELC
uniref:Uncharacterized protein n=1 Tax=Vitis vinifera TaxID=29760 RepID=A5C315_VITVI|nr:hypothetical protein VITISV_005002 [Vitis vinifera]